MPFMTSEVVSGAANKLEAVPIINRIIQNPLWLSIGIIIVVILINIFVFRNVEADESIWRMSVRAGFYMFIVSTVLIFLHDKNLIADMKSANRNVASDAIFENVDKVGVVPQSANPDLIDVQVKVPNWV